MNTVTKTNKPCGTCGKGTAAVNAYNTQRERTAHERETVFPVNPLLQKARIYAAACKEERIAKLPAQLAKLNLPYIIERELPSVKPSETYFDAASRRFRNQVLSQINRPLFWLEDDIDIPDNFNVTFNAYAQTLPADWKVAVIGWGLTYDNEEIKIRRVSAGWWHLEGGTVRYATFSGTQAVLVNSGEWRTKLAGKEFRCDLDLCGVLKNIGVTEIYHADKVLVGTNDPVTTFGDAVVQYAKKSTPRYFGWKTGYRAINAGDFIG